MKHTMNTKVYELSNHLGNVLVTVADARQTNNGTGSQSGTVVSYSAIVVSANDYSAFGAPMPGRSFVSASGYRYGFNGKENDPEAVGTGEGTQDYGFRIYNPSLGRFLSVDPITKKYPELTPYQFASNTPIQAVDLDGLEMFYAPDGTYIGKFGTSTQVRVINAGAISTVYASINLVNDSKLSKEDRARMEKWAFDNSKDVGMTNDELNLRATLATLKQAEAGTANMGHPNDYNGWNGGDKFTEDSYEENPGAYAKHPGTNPSSRSIGSAAGAYGAMKQYYNESDFSPASQDRFAVNSMSDEGRQAAKSGDILKFKELEGGHWTSLPHWKDNETLKKEFKANLALELQGKSKIGTAPGKLVTTKQKPKPATLKTPTQ
jgi:RHS repeat-associated protein